jgi:O-antigen ligase
MLGHFTRQAERGLLGVFIAVLIWAPWPLGSNRPWAVAFLAGALWLLLAAALWLRAQAPSGLPQSRGASSGLGQAAWPLALLVAFVLWVAWQLTPWGHTDEPYGTRLYLLRSLAYTAGFALVPVLACNARRRLLLLYGLLTAAVLQALLAIVLFSTQAQYELLGFVFQQGQRATGTFPNPDHLANYMAMGVAAGVAVMLAQMQPRTRQLVGWQAHLKAALEFMLSTKMLVRFTLVLLVIALVLTRSRMGNGAFFAGLLLVALWAMRRSTALRKPAALLVASLLVVDIIVVGQWVGLDKVVNRLQATDVLVAHKQEAEAAAAGQPYTQARREESLEERLRAAHDTLYAVEARPWHGWGGGSFYSVFPGFKRSELLNLRWDHAHNDYVQIAADVGWPGLGLLVGVFALTLRRVARLIRSPDAHERGIACGVALAMFCALLHGMVDFNLHIASNALTLSVILAVAWSMQSAGRSAGKAPQTRK